MGKRASGEGVIQAFRRAECTCESARFKLRGLDPAVTYRVTNLDDPDAPVTFTGKELIETGFLVAIPRAPQAVVLVYRRTTH